MSKLPPYLQHTMAWEMFEQVCLWQLVACEVMRIDYPVTVALLSAVLPVVDWSTHHEVQRVINN